MFRMGRTHPTSPPKNRSVSVSVGVGFRFARFCIERKYIKNDELNQSLHPFEIPAAERFPNTQGDGECLVAQSALQMPNFSVPAGFRNCLKIRELGTRAQGSAFDRCMTNWRNLDEYPKNCSLHHFLEDVRHFVLTGGKGTNFGSWSVYSLRHAALPGSCRPTPGCERWVRDPYRRLPATMRSLRPVHRPGIPVREGSVRLAGRAAKPPARDCGSL